jgi:DNA-directed RNA polymerase subunit RPC12/RpoP
MNTDDEMDGRGGSVLLERDVQLYLSKNLSTLGIAGLRLVAYEHVIPRVGRIDLLADTPDNRIFAVELKRGQIERQDVGQVQSYMGALLGEFPGVEVHGLLVGQSLSTPAFHAIQAARNIKFVRFQVSFSFTKVELDARGGGEGRPSEKLTPTKYRCPICVRDVLPMYANNTVLCEYCQNPLNTRPRTTR